MALPGEESSGNIGLERKIAHEAAGALSSCWRRRRRRKLAQPIKKERRGDS